MAKDLTILFEKEKELEGFHQGETLEIDLDKPYQEPTVMRFTEEQAEQIRDSINRLGLGRHVNLEMGSYSQARVHEMYLRESFGRYLPHSGKNRACSKCAIVLLPWTPRYPYCDNCIEPIKERTIGDWLKRHEHLPEVREMRRNGTDTEEMFQFIRRRMWRNQKVSGKSKFTTLDPKFLDEKREKTIEICTKR